MNANRGHNQGCAPKGKSSNLTGTAGLGLAKNILFVAMAGLLLLSPAMPCLASCKGGSYIVSSAINPLVIGFSPDAAKVYTSVWIVGKGVPGVISGAGGYLGECSNGGCDSGYPVNRALSMAAPCSGNEVNPEVLLYEASACDFGYGTYAPGSYMITGDWYNAVFDGCPGSDDRLAVFVQQADGKAALFSLRQNGGMVFDLDMLPTGTGFYPPAPQVLSVSSSGNAGKVVNLFVPAPDLYGLSPLNDAPASSLITGVRVYVWSGKGKLTNLATDSSGWMAVGAAAFSEATGSATLTVTLPPLGRGQKQFVACSLLMDSGYESLFTGAPVAPVVLHK